MTQTTSANWEYVLRSDFVAAKRHHIATTLNWEKWIQSLNFILHLRRVINFNQLTWVPNEREKLINQSEWFFISRRRHPCLPSRKSVLTFWATQQFSLSAVCVVQFFMRRRARNGLFGFGHTKLRWPNDLILHKTRLTALAVEKYMTVRSIPFHYSPRMQLLDLYKLSGISHTAHKISIALAARLTHKSARERKKTRPF